MAEIRLGTVAQRVNAQLLTATTYNEVLSAVHTGAIPARQDGGRWVVDETDIPAAVEYFSRQPARRRA